MKWHVRIQYILANSIVTIHITVTVLHVLVTIPLIYILNTHQYSDLAFILVLVNSSIH